MHTWCMGVAIKQQGDEILAFLSFFNEKGSEELEGALKMHVVSSELHSHSWSRAQHKRYKV